MHETELVNIIEALLFVSPSGIPVEKLADLTEVEDLRVLEALDRLSNRLTDSGSALCLREGEEGYKLFTRPEYAPYIKRYLYPRSRTGLSQAALETLSIVAMEQPVTKGHIEEIRGVDSSGAVNSLCEKGFIEETGRLDVPGKPAVFSTTGFFLDFFGLASPQELKTLLTADRAEETQSNDPAEATETVTE